MKLGKIGLNSIIASVYLLGKISATGSGDLQTSLQAAFKGALQQKAEGITNEVNQLKNSALDAIENGGGREEGINPLDSGDGNQG
ncbi:ECU08_1885 [Encephalitozoon cuniculi GB-M1]|uniref:ECU08_1885 protein n=1 Tax=Encephalitozoon cuniculi (strain GB-M1) TaxID=284813 RepID=I7L8L1_ENCCU|nr:uncharacterized protein ECU08_1885 [Encephalitozoon cuniculi GB-M1]CCI73972.1 ECU08_1885 [Encephalitozoon cuniculi GB-M1]